MHKSVYEKLRQQMEKRGYGAVFVTCEFLELGYRAAVDEALSRLAREGVIRRLGRGLYDYPQLHPEPGRPPRPGGGDRGGRPGGGGDRGGRPGGGGDRGGNGGGRGGFSNDRSESAIRVEPPKPEGTGDVAAAAPAPAPAAPLVPSDDEAPRARFRPKR